MTSPFPDTAANPESLRNKLWLLFFDKIVFAGIAALIFVAYDQYKTYQSGKAAQIQTQLDHVRIARELIPTALDKNNDPSPRAYLIVDAVKSEAISENEGVNLIDIILTQGLNEYKFRQIAAEMMPAALPSILKKFEGFKNDWEAVQGTPLPSNYFKDFGDTSLDAPSNSPISLEEESYILKEWRAVLHSNYKSIPESFELLSNKKSLVKILPELFLIMHSPGTTDPFDEARSPSFGIKQVGLLDQIVSGEASDDTISELERQIALNPYDSDDVDYLTEVLRIIDTFPPYDCAHICKYLAKISTLDRRRLDKINEGNNSLLYRVMAVYIVDKILDSERKDKGRAYVEMSGADAAKIFIDSLSDDVINYIHVNSEENSFGMLDGIFIPKLVALSKISEKEAQKIVDQVVAADPSSKSRLSFLINISGDLQVAGISRVH